MSTWPTPPIASNAFVSRFVKICRSWCGSPWIGRSASGTSMRTSTSPLSDAWLSAIVMASRMTSATRDVLDLQADRPHEGEHLLHDHVRHLRFLDDVGEDGLRVGRLGELPLQQAGHDLDPGERVLHFVRDGRRHLAERGQPVAQALALLELLDAGQVLEEERRADVAPARVLDVRQRVADHLARSSSAAARRGWAGARARTRRRRCARRRARP